MTYWAFHDHAPSGLSQAEYLTIVLEVAGIEADEAGARSARMPPGASLAPTMRAAIT
jgi:hypothetical protein